MPLSLSLVFVTKPLQLLSFAPPKTDYLGKAGSSAHHIDSVDGFDLLPLLGFNMEHLSRWDQQIPSLGFQQKFMRMLGLMEFGDQRL